MNDLFTKQNEIDVATYRTLIVTLIISRSPDKISLMARSNTLPPSARILFQMYVKADHSRCELRDPMSLTLDRQLVSELVAGIS